MPTLYVPQSQRGETEIMDNEYHDGEKWDFRKIADTINEEKEFKCVEDGQNRTLYHYIDGVWKPNGETVVQSKALDLTNELLRPSNINQVIRIIKNRNRVDKEAFQMQDYIVPFDNGVYHLKDQEFKEHDPSYNLRYKHPVAYTEAFNETDKQVLRDSDPTFEGDIDEAVESRESRTNEFICSLVDTERKRSILKETVGLALMTNYPIQEAPILYGRGKNGKNMYVKMLKEMSGKWHSLDLGEFTDDQFAKAELHGSSFVFFDELGHINDPGKLKSFIGEQDMRVREMQQLGKMGKQTAIPIMAGNDIPTPPEQNEGFFRRFCIVDFPYKFTNQDDDYKDQMPKNEIRRKYFNTWELSKLATEVVQDLSQVIKQEGYTHSYNTEQKRQVWNLKSSLVYSFLNLFVEQGEKPNQTNTTSCDAVIKENLLEMCNTFVNSVNGTKVRQHELTQAIENNPDLDRGSDARKEGKDGKEHRAYSGIKLVIPSFHQFQGLDDLETARSSVLLQHSDYFEVLSAKQYINTLEIVETELIGKVIKTIRSSRESSLSLLTIVKALNLEESDIQQLYESDYLHVEGKIAESFTAPEISINSEKLDKDIEESGELIKESGDFKPVSRWVGQRIDDLTKNQQVRIGEYIIDPGTDQGYSEDSLEEEIGTRVSDGEIYKPEPNKIQLL